MARKTTKTDSPKTTSSRTRKPKAQENTMNAIATETTETIALIDSAENEPKPIPVRCYECDNRWEIEPGNRAENVKCPSCGAWCRVRLHPNRENYHRGLGTTASGNSTLDIGDGIADALRGLNPIDGELFREAASRLIELGPESLSKAMRKDLADRWTQDEIASYFAARWEKRNLGMQRMNMGNVMRAAEKRRADLDATTLPEKA